MGDKNDVPLRTSAEILIDLPTHLLSNERSLAVRKVWRHVPVPDLRTWPADDEVKSVSVNSHTRLQVRHNSNASYSVLSTYMVSKSGFFFPVPGMYSGFVTDRIVPRPGAEGWSRGSDPSRSALEGR